MSLTLTADCSTVTVTGVYVIKLHVFRTLARAPTFATLQEFMITTTTSRLTTPNSDGLFGEKLQDLKNGPVLMVIVRHLLGRTLATTYSKHSVFMLGLTKIRQ